MKAYDNQVKEIMLSIPGSFRALSCDVEGTRDNIEKLFSNPMDQRNICHNNGSFVDRTAGADFEIDHYLNGIVRIAYTTHSHRQKFVLDFDNSIFIANYKPVVYSTKKGDRAVSRNLIIAFPAVPQKIIHNLSGILNTIFPGITWNFLSHGIVPYERIDELYEESVAKMMLNHVSYKMVENKDGELTAFL